mgnify:CR=1 FL=1
MDFNITAIILSLMILAWQVMLWKKIKLKKWQDYTMSSIMIVLKGWLTYLAILCSPDIDAFEQMKH